MDFHGNAAVATVTGGNCDWPDSAESQLLSELMLEYY